MNFKTDLERLLQAHVCELDLWLQETHKVDLLQAVANGEYGVNGCDDDNDSLYDTVSEYLDDVWSMLFRGSFNSEESYDGFYDTEWGQMFLKVGLWLECDELITLKEAAMILRGSAEGKDLVSVNGYIKRGKLEVFTDLSETNPQRQKRVRRSDVEKIKADPAKNTKSVTWNGVGYSSITEAAEAMGITVAALSYRLRKGYTSDDDMPGRETEIEWNGVKYPSIKQACETLGVNEHTMQYRIGMGYTSDDDLKAHKSKPCVWNGIEYESITEAAYAVGVTPQTMANRVRNGYTCDDDVPTPGRPSEQ